MATTLTEACLGQTFPRNLLTRFPACGLRVNPKASKATEAALAVQQAPALVRVTTAGIEEAHNPPPSPPNPTSRQGMWPIFARLFEAAALGTEGIADARTQI
jgi:hypothetical protein